MVQIQKQSMVFLSDIKINNNRDWFLQNHGRYLEAKADFESFVQTLINKISDFDPILKGLEAKTCIFRINRDIRFSNDKTLYKSHMGAFITRGGKSNGDRFAGYYFHIEPGGNSMIAGGAYVPPAPWLSAIREKIDENGAALVKIINNKNFKEAFGCLEGEKLKSIPKGYLKDHPYIELLKQKSFLAMKMLKDNEITGKNCLEIVLNAAKVMKPLNDFLNDY